MRPGAWVALACVLLAGGCGTSCGTNASAEPAAIIIPAKTVKAALRTRRRIWADGHK